jgi:hypothetical protein
MKLALSTAFGFVMVAAAALQADDAALGVAALAVLAVLVGNVFRPAATLAVLLTAAVVVVGDAPVMSVAMAGLSAACYLVVRHAATMTAPTIIGAVGFSAAAMAAVLVPVEMAWVPLVAPLAVVALIVLVTRPFWSDP